MRSKLPDTSHLPSGLQLMEYTSSSCPLSIRRPILMDTPLTTRQPGLRGGGEDAVGDAVGVLVDCWLVCRRVGVDCGLFAPTWRLSG